MSNNSPKERRGGPRQILARKLDRAIDVQAISDLLRVLAPDIGEQRLRCALGIVTKGVEGFRENAPCERTLAESLQKNRRAVDRFMRGKTAYGRAPLNGIKKIRGRFFGASSDGIVEIFDAPPVDTIDGYEGLDRAIATPLRGRAMHEQQVAGMTHLNPYLPFNGGWMAGVSKCTHAEWMLDQISDPRDWNAELGGYAYLAITRGLGIAASTAWYEWEPERMRRGWNYGRLLRLAGTEAGAQLPSTREGMEGLMKRGKHCALEMLSPAFTYPGGRVVTHFDIEFPDAPRLA